MNLYFLFLDMNIFFRVGEKIYFIFYFYLVSLRWVLKSFFDVEFNMANGT